MVFSFHIDHDLRIIVYTHRGDINKDELDAAWTELLQIREFTDLGYNLLSDYRGSRFDIPIKYAYEILNFFSTIIDIVDGKKQSIIVDNAFSAAASILLSTIVKSKVGFIIKVFTTEEAARAWLLSDARF